MSTFMIDLPGPSPATPSCQNLSTICGAEILTTPALAQNLGRHRCWECEENGRCNHQPHAEAAEVRPARNDKRRHDRRQGGHHPASTPERRVPAAEHTARGDRATEAQQETELVQRTVPAHRWRPGRCTGWEAGTGICGEETGNDQPDAGDANKQRTPGAAWPWS